MTAKTEITSRPAADVVADQAFARSVLPRRSFGAHKWGVGGLLIVAGAPGYAGAAVLSAMAAGRAGAGIINVALPGALAGIVTSAVPEAATIALPSGESAGTGRRAVELIEEKLAKSKAVLIGPGLGEDAETDALLAAMFGAASAHGTIGFGASAATAGRAASGAKGPLSETEHPIVVDADALNWLAKHGRWWGLLPARRAVLTPHVGEMARLLDTTADRIIDDPVATVRAAAKAWNQTVVLKYGYTVASDGDRVIAADDAPVSLATAGTGDVFSGTIGAFLAQGVEPLAAAGLAIFVGSRAARRLEQRTGPLGLIASDLPLAIAEELAALDHAEASNHG